MPVSTPQSPKPPQPKSILLIGPPGGGKTTLMMQFPGLHVIDCDLNLDGPERYLRDVRKLPISYAYDYAGFEDDARLKPVPIELCYDRVMKLLDVAKADDSKVVAVDSLTWVNEYIIRKILKAQSRPHGEMEARDWIPFKSKMLDLMASKIRGMGKTVICTVHEVNNWVANPKDIMSKILDSRSPSVQGSIVDYFGAFFTDMWRCESYVAPGNKTAFKLYAARTTKDDLKNSCGMPAEIINPTFEEVNKYLKLSL